MRITEWLLPQNPCKRFSTPELLFQGLVQLDNQAILCVQSKALNSARKFAKQYQLPDSEVDDILNQSTLIFLRKIKEGSYVFQGHSPSSYLVEVIKRVSMTSARKISHNTESIENQYHLEDPDQETNQKRLEAAELVGGLLQHLGEPCEQVIRIYHIDGYSDEEAVQQGLTRYTTIDSLKMKRSDCMKKLIQLAQAWKTTNPT